MAISVISGENETSVHLHEKFGFEYAGTIGRRAESSEDTWIS